MGDDEIKAALEKLVTRLQENGVATSKMRDGTLMLVSKEKLRAWLASCGDEEFVTVFIQNPVAMA